MKKIQGPKGSPQLPPTARPAPAVSRPAAATKPSTVSSFPQTGWTDAAKASRPIETQHVAENPRLALLRPHRPDPISGNEAARGQISARHLMRAREAIEVPGAMRATIPMRFEPRSGVSTEPRRGHVVD